METNAIGLDIGGANLKLATRSGEARSRRFELWKHPTRLAGELGDFIGAMPADWPVGVTMTGELCDCFRTKREGVIHIVRSVEQELPARNIHYWSTDRKFVSAKEACEKPLKVAAANWHAQSTFAERFAPKGLSVLIDTGSTTTDVIPILDGRTNPEGFTDVERLRTGELLYFGIRRTPLCSLSQNHCAEFFATTHDAHVLLGNLPEEPHSVETADGRPMTREFAWERIARMLGGDRETVTAEDVVTYANACLQTKCDLLLNSIRLLESRFNHRLDSIILSGSGERITARMLQNRLPSMCQISVSELFGSSNSEAACAYSVVQLLSEWSK